jgi:P-type Ca2+ transporter type 2C
MNDSVTPALGHGAAAPAEPAGLSSAEAARRLAAIGPNILVRESRAAAAREFLRTLADPMAVMLAVAAAVYYALGQTTEAAVLLGAIVPVLGVDVILEARSRAALRELARAVAPRVRALRDGRETEVPTEQIVPGDVLLIAEGDIVHADGVVRQAANLALDESQLTGESEPVEKRPYAGAAGDGAVAEESRVFAGSRVAAGHGRAEVAVTGERTRYGNIARMVAEGGAHATPLQRRTARMVRYLVAGALVLSVVLFAVSRWRGEPVDEAFLYAVSLAMSAVGEEFLLVLTLFLSLGAWRLTQHRVLVRRLASVETLGATTVICLDKTGTLTRGDFALQEHVPLRPATSEDELLEAAALACEPNAADTMERSILAHCSEHGVDVGALQAHWRLIYDHPFDPIGKHMSHVWSEDGEGGSARERIVAKGALEGVLEHCAVTRTELAAAESAHAELAARGMRVLAVAAGDAPAEGRRFSGAREQDERGLRLLGLLGFQDPLRAEVPAAVAECQRAGVRLKLITGDHAMTAHAIADASGIAHDNNYGIVTGAELDRLDAAGFAATVRRAAIFARVRPEQKYAIVEALERAGEVVAMTGDGINDAPALRRADIGVAMGRRGTEVARAASDIVLLDDDFAALVVTIREGRRIFDNIQRAFLYLVGFKVMLVTLTLAAPLVGLPLLLLPVDLVWFELIVHPVSALAFEGAEPAADLMERAPRDPAAPLVALAPAVRIAIAALLLSAGALALYALRLGRGEDYARGVAVAAAVAGSLAMVWAGLAGPERWWRMRIPTSARFWVVTALVAASVPAFMLLRPIAGLLLIAPIDARDWGWALALAIGAIGWFGFFGRRERA